MPKLGPAVSSSSGRSGRGRRVMTSLAEINVVPLVDVMLVLLIIFMVAAPMIQRGIDVKLPQSRRATSVTGERVEITIPDTMRRSSIVFLGKEQVKLDRSAGARAAEDGNEPEQGSVPPRRLDGAISGSDERHRRLEGGRRAEHRHGGENAERALMDVTDVLRDRMQTPAGLQKMMSRVDCRAPRARGRADLRARRLSHASRRAADVDDHLAQRQRAVRRTAA